MVDHDLEFENVRRELKRIHPKSPVRSAAEALLFKNDRRLDEIEPIILVLSQPGKHRWRERLVAPWLLGKALIPREKRYMVANALYGALTERSYRSSAIERAMGRAAKAFFWIASSLSVLITISWTSVVRAEDVSWLIMVMLMTTVLLFLFLGLIVSPIVVPISVTCDNRVRAAAAIALGSMAYPTAAGGLAGAVFDGSRSVSEAASAALPRTLNALAPEYYGRSGPYTISNLCRLLSHGDDRTVLIALEALGRVGGGSAIPSVQRVQRWGASAALKRAAALILPVLEERKRRETDSQVLLRASGAPELPEEMLLRPVLSGAASDPSVLLRVVEGERD